jgi:hypothetical protein
LAIVYIRQSTPQQVERHQESTRLQYALVERACQFGWDRDAILVIDDDLGHTGSTVEGRVGFQRLVAEVSLGRVGLVLGIEMSRLARSCLDWHQLLEICAVFDTLIADPEGVVRSVMLVPLFVCARSDLDVFFLVDFERLHCGKCLFCIRKDEPLVDDIALNCDRAVANAPINPAPGDLQPFSQFGDRQPSRRTVDTFWCGLSQYAMTPPNVTHRGSRDIAAPGRAVSSLGQPVGDRGVVDALTSPLEEFRFHFRAA